MTLPSSRLGLWHRKLDLESGEVSILDVVFDCNLFLQAVGKGGNYAFGYLELVMDGKVTLFMSENWPNIGDASGVEETWLEKSGQEQ